MQKENKLVSKPNFILYFVAFHQCLIRNEAYSHGGINIQGKCPMHASMNDPAVRIV